MAGRHGQVGAIGLGLGTPRQFTKKSQLKYSKYIHDGRLKKIVLVLSYSAGDLRDKCSTSAGKVVSKHPLNSEFFYFEIGEPRGRYRWQSIVRQVWASKMLQIKVYMLRDYNASLSLLEILKYDQKSSLFVGFSGHDDVHDVTHLGVQLLDKDYPSLRYDPNNRCGVRASQSSACKKLCILCSTMCVFLGISSKRKLHLIFDVKLKF